MSENPLTGEALAQEVREMSKLLEGMTGDHMLVLPRILLRDYFAGQALCGQLGVWIPDTSVADGAIPKHAELAYELADAMLKEREK